MISRSPETKAAALKGWAKVFGFPPDPASWGKYVKRSSPDKKLAVIFEPGIECSMMRYAYQFRLVDAHRAVVEEFRGLTAQEQRAWWTPDSRIVAIPADGLLLYELHRRRYSVVPFDIFQNELEMGVAGIRVSVSRKEFVAWFGDKFQPPRPVSFRFASLHWFPAPATGKWKLGPALRSAPRLRWLPPPSKELRAYAKAQGITLPRD